MGMIEGDRIDTNFAGIRVLDLVDAIEKLSGQKKGEFESTADFNARKAAALSGKILGDSGAEDTFAFVLSVAKGSRYSDGLKYDFNADTSELRLFVHPNSLPLNGIGAPDYETNQRQSNDLDQFDLAVKTISNSTYVGSNAYGAKVTVEKTSMIAVGVAAIRIPFLNFERKSYSNPNAAAKFKMENARAARELPALKVLVAMKLADPFIVYGFSHIEPERDSPFDISLQRKYLTGNILGMVFYSGLTGDVFLRLPENFGKPEPKPEPKPEDKPAA